MSLVRKGAPDPALALEADLKCATRSGSVQVPEEALRKIVQASHQEDSRRQIMQHLHACLTEVTSAQWRTVFAGMLVLEELLERGAESLAAETASGIHFDLTQRLSFLERYEFGFDQRVEDLLRRKAKAVRELWDRKQLTVDSGFSIEQGLQKNRAFSECTQELSTTDDDGGESAASVDCSPCCDSWASGTAASMQGNGSVDIMSFVACAPAPQTDAACSIPTPPAPLPSLLGGSDVATTTETVPPPRESVPDLLDLFGASMEAAAIGSASPQELAAVAAVAPAPISVATPAPAVSPPQIPEDAAAVAPTTAAALDWLQVAAAKGLLFDELAQRPPASLTQPQGQEAALGSLLDF